VRGASLDEKSFFELGQNAYQVDSGGKDQILEMGFGHVMVTVPAHAESPYPLRKDAFKYIFLRKSLPFSS
jgi:hypothetical protein